jgi:hypothetical protein
MCSSSSSDSVVVITVVELLFTPPTTALRTADVEANDDVVIIAPEVDAIVDDVFPNFSLT